MLPEQEQPQNNDLPDIPELPKKPEYQDKMLHYIAQLLCRLLQQNSHTSAPCHGKQTVEKTVEVPVEKVVEKIVEVPVEKIVEKPDAFSREMASWREIHRHFGQDQALWKALMPTGYDSEQPKQLIMLMVRLSQWETVTEIWDELAARCKQEKRPAAKGELGCLKYALIVHNLIFDNKKAELREIQAGEQFNYETMQRGNSSGETVKALWLPELCNAGGVPEKKALVETE